jgi:3',5'-cyclic AMP phosphodiesterase CpdA
VPARRVCRFTGTYAREYFVDVDGVRVILVSPTSSSSAPTRRYGPGDAGRTFLENAIRDAKAKGMWTVVGMHHPCLTRGSHTCADTSPAVSDVALAEGVDLVLSGHNHNYERSHQIDGTTAAPVVVDSDSSMVKGAGTVFAVVGNAGHNPRAIGSKTSIWAVNNGTNSPGGFAYGYGQLRVTASELAFSHVSTGGATLNDTFVISR